MAMTSDTAASGGRARGVGLLADRWWVPVLRGAAAVIFGLLTFIAPGASVFALVVLFGVYAIVNDVPLLGVTASVPAGVPRWGWLLFESIASIVAGVLTLIWPAITALLLLYVIAAWAIAIAFGVLLAVFPGAGALPVVIWIGAYALVFGALLVALGLRLRSLGPLERARGAPWRHPGDEVNHG